MSTILPQPEPPDTGIDDILIYGLEAAIEEKRKLESNKNNPPSDQEEC